MKVGSWNERNKGLWAFTECLRLGTDNKGYKPGLEAFKGFLLTTCFWEQGLLFHDKLPLEFRQSYVMSWAVGTVFYAWMVWCLSRKATCRSALSSVPWDHKTAQLDNKLCQSTRGCPWVFLSECGSPSLIPYEVARGPLCAPVRVVTSLSPHCPGTLTCPSQFGTTWQPLPSGVWAAGVPGRFVCVCWGVVPGKGVRGESGSPPLSGS